MQQLTYQGFAAAYNTLGRGIMKNTSERYALSFLPPQRFFTGRILAPSRCFIEQRTALLLKNRRRRSALLSELMTRISAP
ncbi:hypothetical protein DPMN_187222 [Dreissena polymorpha]|uniref:Uncharacterized protein n=1 Tax=Dreissena polymorpha TaxID=45954 RepID=A0A9D4DNN5_DREPO|nr:hypothetical protein DPMN_187222 [Dreissena polymorpha]